MAIEHWKHTPMKVDNGVILLNENKETQVELRLKNPKSVIEGQQYTADW
jgi:hypothetical protein